MPHKKQVIRKLSAILSADVKGYSLLMAADESFTIETLKKYRGIMSQEIKGRNGRVVDTPGDNLLAEFPSAVDAVECAVEIQKHLKKENEALEKEKKLQYRMGVNIGDVVQDGDRIYGSGVNVAARIEGLAEPGGICISRNVYDQIKDKVPFGYKYFGGHEVKNIKDPVRVYKVLTAPEDAGKLIGEAPKPIAKKWIWATVVLAAIVLTSTIALVYQKITEPDIEPASVEEMAYPLPKKPSIAVLPFDNLSGDPGQDYLADGMTENIITALSNIPEMFVIARNSVYTYKGKPTKTQKVAKDLGIRYVLEGSIQKENNRIRITGQLIDAITGHHLWAEKYDRKLDDLFAIQDEITLQIVSSLQVKLTDGEQARLRRKSTQSLKAWEFAVKGYSYWHRYTKEDNAAARELFQRATEEDPEYAWAWTMLGFTYFIDTRYGWNMPREASYKKMVELAHKSVLLDGSDPDVHALLAQIQLWQKNYEMAIKEGEKALLLGPNSAENHAILGMIYRFAGRFEDSIRMTEKAIRLHPYYPDWYLYSLEYSYYYLGEHEKAIDTARKHIKLIEDQGGTDTFWQHLILAQNYVRIGREKLARYHASEAIKQNPEYSFEWERKSSLYKDPALIEQQIDDLRKAGLSFENAASNKEPTKLPEKPSIAILPFDNLSDDSEQEYFSDGLTDDIITTLSKCPRLFVIARDSVFSFKEKKVPLKKLSKDLGVRYFLEGSVRKSRNRLRISAQLIDAMTERTLWAERYEKPVGDLFAIQDEITLSILRALQVNLSEGDQARLIGRKTDRLDAYLKAIQAQEQFYLMNRQGSTRAKELAKESIDLDPTYAFPYTILANAHMLDAWFNFSEHPEKSMKLSADAAEKALSLDAMDPATYSVLSNLYVMQRQYEKAITAAEKAIELSPAGARAHFSMGIALQFACKFDAAIPYFEEAIRLNPYPPGIYFRALASVYRFAGRYDESLVEYQKALNLNPGDLFTNLGLTSLYISMDRIEDAKHQAREVLRLYPNFSLEYFAKTLTLKDQSVINAMIENLRKAGLT